MRLATIVLLSVIAVVLVGWAIYVVLNEHEDDEISVIIKEAGLRVGLLPYALGLVMGHWGSCIDAKPMSEPMTIAVLISVGLISTSVGITSNYICGFRIPWSAHAILGWAMGMTLWPV